MTINIFSLEGFRTREEDEVGFGDTLPATFGLSKSQLSANTPGQSLGLKGARTGRIMGRHRRSDGGTFLRRLAHHRHRARGANHAAKLLCVIRQRRSRHSRACRGSLVRAIGSLPRTGLVRKRRHTACAAAQQRRFRAPGEAPRKAVARLIRQVVATVVIVRATEFLRQTHVTIVMRMTKAPPSTNV